ncbi:unnamed protein product [Urochloa humidicola]
MQGATADVEVQILSRHVIRPEPATSPGGAPPETVHLTPWDLRMITVDYIQKGLLLPKPQSGTGSEARHHLIDSLASSFARALGRFYPLAGRLAVTEADATDGGGGAPCQPGITVSLRCNGEGAELVHAVAPDLTASDIVTAPAYCIPPVVWSLFPLNGALGADVLRPVLAAQVTELADGVFIGMSLNHSVGDGSTFWHLFNTWSEISRRSSGSDEDDAGGELSLSTPPPVLDTRQVVPRWLPGPNRSTVRQARGHRPATGVRAGARVLLRFLVGEREEAEGEGERGDVRHGGGDHLVAASAAGARVASGVPSKGAPTGAGDDVRPPRRVSWAGTRHPTWLHGERRDDGDDGEVRRRRGRREGSGLGGVAAEPRRGVVRRGEGAA